MTWIKCRKCKRDAYPNEIQENGLCKDCLATIHLTNGEIQQRRQAKARQTAWSRGEGFEVMQAASWECKCITESPDGHFLVWDETQANLVAACYTEEEALTEVRNYANWLMREYECKES